MIQVTIQALCPLPVTGIGKKRSPWADKVYLLKTKNHKTKNFSLPLQHSKVKTT